MSNAQVAVGLESLLSEMFASSELDSLLKDLAPYRSSKMKEVSSFSKAAVTGLSRSFRVGARSQTASEVVQAADR